MSSISILLPNLVGGGAERVCIDLGKEFKRAGHKVEIVLMHARGPLLEEALDSFRVLDLATPRIRGLPVALFRYLRCSRPDALLAAMWPLTVIAPVSARLSGQRCSVLVSEHNTLSVQYGDWGRIHRGVMRASMAFGYRLANHRVGVSRGVVEDIASLSGLPGNYFDVIHNPVPRRPEPEHEAIEAAERLWSGSPGARIVTVGSMKAQKNHALLLRAFARLDRSDARLMFVGDGKGRDELLALSRELGVADRVILAGFHPDPTPFYMTADLFVLSSDYEGFGNVIVEALACGTSVVSTDCPSGPAEILAQGKYGKLVPVGDQRALASAIGSSLKEKVDTQFLKDRAAEFSPAKAASQYLGLLGYMN